MVWPKSDTWPLSFFSDTFLGPTAQASRQAGRPRSPGTFWPIFFLTDAGAGAGGVSSAEELQCFWYSSILLVPNTISLEYIYQYGGALFTAWVVVRLVGHGIVHIVGLIINLLEQHSHFFGQIDSALNPSKWSLRQGTGGYRAHFFG